MIEIFQLLYFLPQKAPRVERRKESIKSASTHTPKTAKPQNFFTPFFASIYLFFAPEKAALFRQIRAGSSNYRGSVFLRPVCGQLWTENSELKTSEIFEYFRMFQVCFLDVSASFLNVSIQLLNVFEYFWRLVDIPAPLPPFALFFVFKQAHLLEKPLIYIA